MMIPSQPLRLLIRTWSWFSTGEPRKRFLEKLQREITVHGRIFYCELAEVRLASEEILSKPSFTATADQLLKLTRTDVSLLIAFEFHGLKEYSRSREIEGVWKGEGIDYYTAVNQRRQKTPGMLFIVTADALFRKRVHKVLRERRHECPNLLAAFVYVLREHRDSWSEARLEVLSTPQRTSAAAPTPTHEASGPSDRKKRMRLTRGEKNRAQEARIEALEYNNKHKWSRPSLQTPPALRDSKNSTSSQAPPALRDNRNSTLRPRRVPDTEWKAMSNLGPTGRRCKFWNSSCGCHQPDCGFEHKRLECGGDHRWVDRHRGNQHEPSCPDVREAEQRSAALARVDVSLFAGSLGNFGAKARALGLSTLTTSSMPSKPTDLGFFNR